jgi:hypothetical protein
MIVSFAHDRIGRTGGKRMRVRTEKIIVLRIKMDSVRIILDSDKVILLKYLTLQKSCNTHLLNIAPVHLFKF